MPGIVDNLFVAAAGCDASMAHDNDAVHLAQRLQTMRDDPGGASARQRSEGIDQRAFALHIEVVGHLVEKEHVTLAIKGARHQKQRRLPTGKLLSSLTMLELKGIIRRLPGKRIVLSGK